MQPPTSDSHVLLRYSDHDAPDCGVIEAHEKILKKRGKVVIGKFGRPLGQPHIDRINQQIAAGKPTFLFLVKKGKHGYETHLAELLQVNRTLSEEDSRFVPSYYKGSPYVRVWFRAKSLKPCKKGILDQLIVKSSAFPASSTLPKSVAGFFLVRWETAAS
jgi:hypothetical protein